MENQSLFWNATLARRQRNPEFDVSHFPRLAGEQSGNSLKVVLRAFKELFVLYRDLKSTCPVKPLSADETDRSVLGMNREQAHK
jgi:hypothetical protein